MLGPDLRGELLRRSGRGLAAFVRAVKARPGTVGLAQAGNGTVGHLAGELLHQRAGLQLLQVPYKGAGPAMTCWAARSRAISAALRP